MTIQPGVEQDGYDVFIIFCNEDKEIALAVSNSLKCRNFKVISQLEPDAFKPGAQIFRCIIDHIQKSRVTLLILTEESYTKPWIQLEIIFSAEKSKKDGKMRLRVLLKDLKDDQTGLLKKGLLEKVPDLKLDLTSSEWETKLAEFVRRDYQITDLLPVGCLAHGQVFSHFSGFLKHLLPVVKEKLTDEARNRGIPMEQFSTKYFILLPSSCKVINSLVMVGQSGCTIHQIENVMITVTVHAGKPREFNLTLYRISKGSETYYFVADCPQVLNVIFKLKDKELADVLPKEQIARFYFTLNELLNHSQNSHFNDKVEIIAYNDERQDLTEVMLAEVRRSVDQAMGESSTLPHSERSPQRLISEEGQYETDAVISCADDNQSLEVAELVEDHLKNNGKTVTRERLGMQQFAHLEKGKWIVFIISKKFLDESIKTFECSSALAACINENSLRILPVVLEEVAVNSLPGYMKFITFVSNRETNYLENLLQKMNGDPIKMLDKLPCGDVATGLAWAYVLNYLELTILGRPSSGKSFQERIQQFLFENEIEEDCIIKMFIVVPKSCTILDSVEMEACKGSNRVKMEFLGQLEPIVVNSGGQHQRPFKLYMYKYTNIQTGKSICFICEYATPCRCLYDMANNYQFAGLEKGDMYEQTDNFVTLTKDIINRQVVKEKAGDISNIVDFFYYDGEKDTLQAAIEQTLAQPQPVVNAHGVLKMDNFGPEQLEEMMDCGE